jgi:hypothetical protein
MQAKLKTQDPELASQSRAATLPLHSKSQSTPKKKELIKNKTAHLSHRSKSLITP